MQIKGVGKQVRVHANAVQNIERFIKRLENLRHARKELLGDADRNERIKLIRRWKRLQSQLSNISKPRPFDSRPFLHTVISGKKILLCKAVLVNKSTNMQIYSKNTIDQAIKQLLHVKNNFKFYWERMDKSQRTSMMRLMTHYAWKPVYSARKDMKSSAQYKNAKPTINRKTVKQDNQVQKPKTPIQQNYNPYHEEDFDIYIDSILEDTMNGMDEMQDSTESLWNR